MPDGMRRAVRTRIIAHARADVRLARSRALFKRAAVALALTTAMASGASFAVEGTVPGDALYPVKRASETVTLALLPAGRLEDLMLARIAVRRAEEALRVERQDRGDVAVRGAVEAFRLSVGDAFRGDVEDVLAAERQLLDRLRTMEESELRSELEGVVSSEASGAVERRRATDGEGPGSTSGGGGGPESAAPDAGGGGSGPSGDASAPGMSEPGSGSGGAGRGASGGGMRSGDTTSSGSNGAQRAPGPSRGR